jgi:DnaJ like chaperone protein
MGRLLLLLAAAAAAYFWWLGPERAARSLVGRSLLALLAVGFAFVYLRSPIDLIPDGAPVVGFLDDLIVLLSVLWWLRSRLPAPGPARRGSPEPARAAQRGWDPYDVLGVARGASPEEIGAAYRRRMKEYHPDRVSGLGEELRRLAHEKTLEIQRAYEELRG